MHRILLPFFAVVFLCLAPVGLHGAELPVTQPEQAGFSSDKLNKLAEHYQAFVQDGKISGYSALVARKGQVVHFSSAGMADIAAGTKVNEETIYRIYSMTKPVTGVALMMLWEEGKFKLDDPVSKYLPGFSGQQVLVGEGPTTEPVRREATILDLMTHTSGLAYGEPDLPVGKMYRESGVLNGLYRFDDNNPDSKRAASLVDMSNTLGGLPLMFHPREKWHYSISVDVQGALVEKLSGMPLADFFKTRIFEPLGMKDTAFYVSKDKHARLAEMYAYDEAGKLVPYHGDVRFTIKKPPLMASGGAGLVSTAIDYWRFAQMLSNKGELGGVRLLRPETVEMIGRDHLPEGITDIAWGSKGIGFGIDVAVVLDPEQRDSLSSKGEYYWAGIANSYFFVDPQHEIVVVFMTSLMPPNAHPFHQDLRDLVYGALLP